MTSYIASLKTIYPAIPLAQVAARSSSPSFNGPLVPSTKKLSGGAARVPQSSHQHLVQVNPSISR